MMMSGGTSECSMGPRPNGAVSLTLPGESLHSSLGAFACVLDPHLLGSTLCLQPCRVFVYKRPPQGQTLNICKHTTHTDAAAFPVLWVLPPPGELLPISGKPAPTCQRREGQELICVKCPHHCRFFSKSAGAKVRHHLPERADNKWKPTLLSCLCSRCAMLDEWKICSLRATHMFQLKASNPSLTGSLCPDLHRRRKRHHVMRHKKSPCPGNSHSFSWKKCPQHKIFSSKRKSKPVFVRPENRVKNRQLWVSWFTSAQVS